MAAFVEDSTSRALDQMLLDRVLGRDQRTSRASAGDSRAEARRARSAQWQDLALQLGAGASAPTLASARRERRSMRGAKR